MLATVSLVKHNKVANSVILKGGMHSQVYQLPFTYLGPSGPDEIYSRKKRDSGSLNFGKLVFFFFEWTIDACI